MNLDQFDLRPIKFFTPSEKATLPVSIAIQPDGKPFVVSRYEDDVWDFYPYIQTKNHSDSQSLINWAISLPDGHLLTNPKHTSLLESSKDFIWSLFAQPVEGHKRPTMRTIIDKVHQLVPLLRWMVQIGLRSFSDLAGRTLDYLPVARRKVDGGILANTSVKKRLIVIHFLYLQRDKLLDSLSEHPWRHETVDSLAGVKRNGAHNKPKTPFIPDAIATLLATTALDYIRNRGPMILAARQKIDAVGYEKAAAELAEHTQQIARTTAAREVGFKGTNNLTADIIRLRTSCYIVINMFSGIRDSEMKSLAVNCISPGKSRDGSTDILWLHGTIYKTGIRPKRWLVPPLVKEALDVLTRISVPLRERLKQEESDLSQRIELSIARGKSKLLKRLRTVKTHKNLIFLAKRRNHSGATTALSLAVINNDLKKFCTDFDICGEDNQPYPLHSHQFRRTYARFIARSELGDLLTLRDHFGHWSLNMTAFYADGGADEYETDTELLEMIAKEKLTRQNEIMGNYLNTDAPLANGNHWLNVWRASIRTATNKEDLIAEYAGSLTLTGTGHSWCVGSEQGTCCGGLCVFEPQMCVECNHGLIGPEHRPVWEGIRDQQLEALALDDMGPGGRARAQKIIGEAEKVLRRLDGQEEA